MDESETRPGVSVYLVSRPRQDRESRHSVNGSYSADFPGLVQVARPPSPVFRKAKKRTKGKSFNKNLYPSTTVQPGERSQADEKAKKKQNNIFSPHLSSNKVPEVEVKNRFHPL